MSIRCFRHNSFEILATFCESFWMLTQLAIRGLAVVDRLDVSFEHGLNVITGETGAGKSILIKAMSLLLGSKASTEIVRNGCDQATIIGCFSFSSQHRLVSLFEKLQLPIEPSQHSETFEMIIRRVVTAKGRSSAWVNDVPVTSSVLKDIAGHMIDIMSQFEHSTLCDPSTHTTLVDQFISNQNTLESFRSRHSLLTEKLSEYFHWQQSLSDIQKNLDFVTYRLTELQDFGPRIDDFQETETYCKSTQNVEKRRTSLIAAQEILDLGFHGEPLTKALRQIERAFAQKNEAFSDDFLANIAEIVDGIESLSFRIEKEINNLDFSEDDLRSKIDRLSKYYDFFRKFSVNNIEELMNEFHSLSESLKTAMESEVRRNDYLAELLALANDCYSSAVQLSKERIKAARTLANEVNVELKDLGMPHAEIKVEFLKSVTEPNHFLSEDINKILVQLSADGLEKAHILLKANAGDDFLPLHKIASGGEASRILLALKKAFVTGGDTCILVFDEIDTGVSGRVATMVGKKLRELAKNFQIICISHIPQVVAHADVNYRVEKISKGGKTESQITRLDENQSIEDLARLLSGKTLTKQSYDNARTLRLEARSKNRNL